MPIRKIMSIGWWSSQVGIKSIKPCECGENEFLQVLPKFNKHQVHCVNCGQTGQAMSTKDKAIESWNRRL